ncbi:MAG: HAMP domain-containing protein, partial [Planctomycetales bacterium]|nr:HAMP domain-containing protein [Planctomycetales bacterium]
MLPRSFFWRLVLGNVVLVAIGLGLSGWAIIRQVDHVYRDDITRQLASSAQLIRFALEDQFAPDNALHLQAFVRRLAVNESELRITLIAADGTVLAETQANPEKMESHADRPEVIEALRGGRGESERYSKTLDAQMRYVALRVGPGANPVGVVRVATRARGLSARTTAVRLLAYTIGGAGLLLTLGLALWLAYFWSRPLSHIAQAARDLSRGDLNTHIAWQTTDELGQLARALNRMRRQISTQLATIERQRAKLADLV